MNPKPEAQRVLINERTGRAIAPHAWLADGMLTRMVGLLGRRGLDPGAAIILQPCSSVHTFFMRFSLDVVFVDKSGKVVKVVRDLRPYRFAGVWGGHQAIEWAAGALDDVDLIQGDTLRADQAA